MKSKKSLFTFLIAFLIVLFSLLGINFYKGQEQGGVFKEENKEWQIESKVKVMEVIDGDTIRVKGVDNGKVFRVRYLGIDAPEFEGVSYETCFNSESTDKNRELVLGKELLLEFDKDKYDRFGRVLAYVYTLNNGGGKELFVNLELLKGGYARFYLDKQNILHQDRLARAANSAQGNFLGLWGSCGEERLNKKCVIKGNINFFNHNSYQKHYHLPGDKYYSSTKVNLIKEDKWLCTVEEAEDKGFKRSDWDK